MTQYTKIINKLYGNGTITAKDARRLGIKNLRARVCEMRDQGHLIMTKIQDDGCAKYKFFQRTDYYKNR